MNDPIGGYFELELPHHVYYFINDCKYYET